jgi:hypothetical protein
MTAIQYYETKYPHSVHLPKTAILDLMNEYSEYKHEQHKKNLEKFNSEMYLQVQKKKIEGDKNKP